MAVGRNYGQHLAAMRPQTSFEMLHETIGFIDEDSEEEENPEEEEDEAPDEKALEPLNPNETVEESFGEEIETESTGSAEPPKTERSFSIAYW